jgi:hypothetical protein
MSTTSSHSNEFSIFFNSFSTFISINFTKLKGDLQLTLGTLHHFLLTIINFSKFYNVKQHFLR